MNLRKVLLVAALLMCWSAGFAQDTNKEEKIVFNPHWFMQIQAGASHTVGEAKFKDLISPAAALNVGYKFNPIFGLRAGASAWEAKGAWVTPAEVYKYNFLQGNIDAMFDISNLLCKYNPKRVFNLYAFLGAGLNRTFNNDQAVALNDRGYQLDYLWREGKFFIAGRGGLGINLRLSNHIAFNIEANANVLSDKYNSKKAKNADWQFNALAGFTFKFGKTYKKVVPAAVCTEATPVQAPAKEEPKVVVVEKKEPAPVVVEAMRQNVFFKIGSTVIRESETPKIDALVEYMNKYPVSKVVITGYADAATGNQKINNRLSKGRANTVAEALKAKGIAADRISVDFKGDTVQPFSSDAENRVSICIAE